MQSSAGTENRPLASRITKCPHSDIMMHARRGLFVRRGRDGGMRASAMNHIMQSRRAYHAVRTSCYYHTARTT